MCAYNFFINKISYINFISLCSLMSGISIEKQLFTYLFLWKL